MGLFECLPAIKVHLFYPDVPVDLQHDRLMSAPAMQDAQERYIATGLPVHHSQSLTDAATKRPGMFTATELQMHHSQSPIILSVHGRQETLTPEQISQSSLPVFSRLWTVGRMPPAWPQL